MKKVALIAMSIVVIVSLVMPSTAGAACSSKQQSILDACYASCRQIFVSEPMLSGCYLGCYIGCLTSSAS